ncbi:MAG: hypothetical protein LBG89_00030 [Rickettsiales bacterium]|jgi:hypothetical protein|nr:hypothetical protein [Rickettsiales bacterium]
MKKSKKLFEAAAFLLGFLASVAVLVWFAGFVLLEKPCKHMKFGGDVMAGDAVPEGCGYGRAKVCRSVFGVERLSSCRASRAYLKVFASPAALPENAMPRVAVSKGRPKIPHWFFACNPDAPYYDARLNKCVADCGGDKVAVRDFPGFPSRQCVIKR